MYKILALNMKKRGLSALKSVTCCVQQDLDYVGESKRARFTTRAEPLSFIPSSMNLVLIEFSHMLREL